MKNWKREGVSMNSKIIEDKREIKGLYFNDDSDTCYEVVNGNIIKAYGEPGPHCYVPFFSVEKDGIIISRIPASMVEVVYCK